MNLERPWTEGIILAVDVEANGVNRPDVVEFAVATISSGSPLPSPICWLVRPAEPISVAATRVHGITNEQVRGMPSFADIQRDVAHALGQQPVVGHNVGVDWRLIHSKMPDWEPPLLLDTLALARGVAPGLPSYTLSSLVVHLGLREAIAGTPHRAGYDALAAAYVFAALARRVGDGHASLRDLAASCRFDTSASRQESLF